MRIQTQTYADFVTVTNSIGAIRNMFYHINISTDEFNVHAVVADGKISVNYGQGGSTPSSFATDYPNAIQLTENIGIS